MARQAVTIQKEAGQVGTVSELTSVFESIASMRIGKIKDKVTRSTLFFEELWDIYTQLRIDPAEHFNGRGAPKRDKPNIYLVLTSDAGLSGDIDQRIVATVLENYDPKTTDLIVIGAHGATQFVQNHTKIHRYFRLPDVDQAIDVSPIVAELAGYKTPTVWFQRYVSLSVQEVGRIDLIHRVQALGGDAEKNREFISPRDYLFEPNVDEVVSYLENVMMEIALSQLILESRLAQYASRFTAMSAAKKRSNEMKLQLIMAFNRAKRGEADDRIKEIVNAMNALNNG